MWLMIAMDSKSKFLISIIIKRCWMINPIRIEHIVWVNIPHAPKTQQISILQVEKKNTFRFLLIKFICASKYMRIVVVVSYLLFVSANPAPTRNYSRYRFHRLVLLSELICAFVDRLFHPLIYITVMNTVYT